jgi:hypothetical protein
MGLAPMPALARPRVFGQVRARRESEWHRSHSPCAPDVHHVENRRLLHGTPQVLPPRQNTLYRPCSALGRMEQTRFPLHSMSDTAREQHVQAETTKVES